MGGHFQNGLARWCLGERTYTLSTTSTPWYVPFIAVEFGVRRPLYDVIPERQKGDYLTGKYRYIAHFVERSYPTFLARSRPLAVSGGPIWATYLEKEAGKCPHMTQPYPGPFPGKLPQFLCLLASPLNAGDGGTAALHYLHVTPCEHPGGYLPLHAHLPT